MPYASVLIRRSIWPAPAAVYREAPESIDRRLARTPWHVRLTLLAEGPRLHRMNLTFRTLHPHFVAEVSPVDLRQRSRRPNAGPDPRGDGRARRPRVPRSAVHGRRAARVRAAVRRGAPHADGEPGAREEPARRRGPQRRLEPRRERRDHEVRPAAVACTRLATVCGTRTPRSRTRRAATRCSRRRWCRPCRRTPSSPTCAPRTTRCPRR